ncbi:hypothetical protein ACLOJK_020291 [Asimina triloba]
MGNDIISTPLLHSLFKRDEVPDKFKNLKMPMFGSDFNLTGHVINYNIHMDLQTTSEDLKYRSFPATLDEHGKM